MADNQSIPDNKSLNTADVSINRADVLKLSEESKITIAMRLYRATIDICADKKLDVAIANCNAEHATYLFIKFFQKAIHQVCIHTGSLYEGIFDKDDVIRAAIEYLDRNPKSIIRIAYQDYNTEANVILRRQFVRSIIEHIKTEPGRLEIWDARNTEKKNHFAVMDQSAYRHETDHLRRTALANFGNADAATNFYRDFLSITKNSEKVSMPKLSAP